ncbi:fibronectin type III domain-containing protein [Alistipes sp. Marseille-P5061]|uniref:fibronectin type III domain-containing protein n=1 Tax=Alistipes sp. Marseille-P5061 TaxID=2048242 RepID=UPI00320ADEA0
MKKFRLFCVLTALLPLLVSCGNDSDSPEPVSQLPAPASLASTGDDVSLTFTWEAVSEAKCYAYRFNEGEEVYTNETSVRFEGLTPSTQYAFRVKAVSGDLTRWSDSEWSSTSATTGETPQPPFAITLGEVTFYSAEVTVTPADPSMTYFCNVLPRAEFDAFPSEKELIDAQIAQITGAAELNAMSFEEFCRSMGLLFTGTQSFVTAEELAGDTEYVEYVFGLDYSGKATSELVSASFRTKPEPTVQPSSMTLGLEVVDLTDVSARLQVTPSTADEYYYCFFVLRENLDALGEEGIINLCLDDLNEHISSSDYATVVAEQCHKGNYTFSYAEFAANTEYVGFAFGVGQHGLRAAATTRLFTTEPFMLKDAAGGDDPIRIEVVSWGIENAQIKFIPTSEAVPYRCELTKLADFAGLSDEEILAKDMEKLWNDYGDFYSMMLLNESFTMTRYMPLDPDTEYIAFAYGLSDTEFKATTKLCKVVLRTPAAEGSSVGARTLGLLRR